jgi:predicted RNA-binding protein YlxR (DUF448 family)
MKDKKDLIRVVRTPDGTISLDTTGKMAGRGAYVCPSRTCIAKAVKERRLEKALDKTISEEVYQKLLAELSHGHA